MKPIDVGRENNEDWRNRAQCLNTLDQITVTDLLNKLFEKTVGQLLRHQIRHEKCPALRLRDSANFVI